MSAEDDIDSVVDAIIKGAVQKEVGKYGKALAAGLKKMNSPSMEQLQKQLNQQHDSSPPSLMNTRAGALSNKQSTKPRNRALEQSTSTQQSDPVAQLFAGNNTGTRMKTLISEKKIDFWVKRKANVMLIGKHGIGKTHIALDAAKKSGMKLQYFSCATMDPWVDFIGVPKTKTVTRGGKKVSYLELVRPKAFAFDEVEFIFLDELNRADPKVMNAVLELVQFRSINGKKFKNLKCIWAAINPSASMTGDVAYHVQELDPALMSRFHVRVELPFEAAEDYFVKKFGKSMGLNSTGWWSALNDVQKDAFPPRSLDYALEWVQSGGDVEDVLPKEIAKQDFIPLLDKDFVIEDAIAESYDLVRASNDPLNTDLLRQIRYAVNRREAAPYLKRAREGTMEDISSLALQLLDMQSSKESMSNMMTLIGSISRPMRVRLLSALYTSYIAHAEDDDDEDEKDGPVTGVYDLNSQQVRTLGDFITKKLKDHGAKFKYRKRKEAYELTALDHDELRPVDASNNMNGDDILAKTQAEEEKKRA